MCGIVGYIGNSDASPILIEGLSKLEYRGYDSAGVAIIEDGDLKVTKCKGRLCNLEKKLEQSPIHGNLGIGHTRWATHGEPSDLNSHPHTSSNGKVSVVHNGIIENYLSLREWLTSKGYVFYSETDTEVIPNLIDYFYNGNLLDAVMKAVGKMEGSYAIGVISKIESDKLVAVRKDSPLIVGIGKGESFIASDIPAILNHTRDIYLLNDKELVVLTKEGVQLFSEYGRKIEKEIYHVTWNADAAEKGGFEHFMLKEIHEQPKAIIDTLRSRIKVNEKINLDNIQISKEELEKIENIYIIACGTASYAALLGKYVIEGLASIPVQTECASEFRYRKPLINDKSLMIVISQSGETADTLAALRLANEKGAKTIAVTNVVGSSISREAQNVFYTWAGPEIAVASTKAYVTQLIAMFIIALYFSEVKETLTSEEINKIKGELFNLSGKANEIILNKEMIQKFASIAYMHKDIYFFGRGLDYPVSLEGSMKLKETSYIHSEAFPAGELKHGPIALIDKGTIVVALATQNDLTDKMVSNIKEVKARGAVVLSLVLNENQSIENVSDYVITIPETLDILAPVLEVIPLQLLAYYIAVLRGCDVDKPRNLAKSVTVE